MDTLNKYLYRDVSQLPGEIDQVNNVPFCYTIPSDKSINVYYTSPKQYQITYILISNKYVYQSDTYTSSEPVIKPQNDACQPWTNTITQLPSNYDFIVPVYYSISIFSAIFIFFVAYRLILHPFWRKS